MVLPDLALEHAPAPGRRPRTPAWRAVAGMLWAPRRALAAALEGGWVAPPYLLGMVCSLAVWYLAVQLIPQLGAPAGPEGAGGPGMPPEGFPGPPIAMGGPRPLPLEALRAALQPEFLALAALAAPWFGGLWRALMLQTAAALTGVRQPFRRAFGLAGYSMVPLWLGQLAAAGLAAVLLATGPAAPAGREAGTPGMEPGAGAPAVGAPGAMPMRVIGRGRMVVVRPGPVFPGGPGFPVEMPGPSGPGGGSGRPSFSTVPVRWTLDRLVPDLKPGLGRRLLGGLDFFHLWHLGLLTLALHLLVRRWSPALWTAAGVLGTWLLLAALEPRMPQVLTWVGLLR